MTTPTPRLPDSEPPRPRVRGAFAPAGKPVPTLGTLRGHHDAYTREVTAIPSDGDAMQIALALDALMEDACARAAAPTGHHGDRRFALRQTLEDINHLSQLLRARCRVPRAVGVRIDEFARALHAVASA